METRNLTCIGCPLGCNITVTLDGGDIKSVEGNTCPRGRSYAIGEVTNPTRTVTSTVLVNGGIRPVTSVKTADPIPKEKIFDCMKEINKVQLSAPVSIGDVAVADVCGTGVNVVVTAND